VWGWGLSQVKSAEKGSLFATKFCSWKKRTPTGGAPIKKKKRGKRGLHGVLEVSYTEGGKKRVS